MIRNKKAIIILISILFATGISVIIAYAALQKTLTVSMSKINQNALRFEVKLSSFDTVYGIKGSSSDKTVCKDAKINGNMVTGMESHFFSAGESCKYSLFVTNSGQIDARISNIEFTKPSNTSCTISGSTMECEDITYTLTHQSSGNKVNVGELLNKGGSDNIDIKVEYTGYIASDYSFEQNGFSVTITYEQA